MVFLTGLTSCISEPKNDNVSLFISELNNTENIEYNGVQAVKTGESQEKQYIHVEYTKNPFSLYQRIGTLDGSSFVILEPHLRDQGETADYSVKTGIIESFNEDQLSFNKNGDFIVDSTLIKDPTENAATLKGKEKQLMTQYFDQMIIYDIGYLIEKNMRTFKEREKIGDTEYIKYDGKISVDSVLDRYSDFGRERIKAKMKMVDIEPELKENASEKEMREELMTLHNGMDIAEGIYELVFADKSTPISIWIPIDAEEPYKITIDYSNAYKNKNIKLFNLSPKNNEYEKTVNYNVFLDK